MYELSDLFDALDTYGSANFQVCEHDPSMKTVKAIGQFPSSIINNKTFKFGNDAPCLYE